MTLVPSPRLRPQEERPDPARTLDTLATVLLTVLAVGTLYFAREILVPIAIAIIGSFVLSPPIRLLRKLGIGKTVAVGLTVLTSFLIAVGLGAILARQISDLAGESARFQTTINAKISGVREFTAHNLLLAKLDVVIAAMSQNAPPPAKPSTKPAVAPVKPGATTLGRDVRGDAGQNADSDTGKTIDPVRVEIVSPPPGVLSILQSVAGSTATPLATTFFVAIFIVFMLMQREDLRNRFIRLMGSNDLQRTTMALTEAARRLSRYFLAQVLLNTAFGVVVAIAMAIIGVPSAILWGIVAIFMRFIPYIGSIGAALLPVCLAAAASPGWSMVIETAILFLIAEGLTGQVVEPLVYGRNTGLSPIAIVVSATFWTWLWGPIGLVLATPLTVCLVVFGRHVDRLAFLDVLLGDAPALTEIEAFYQRMLAGDPSEIVEHADGFLADHSLLDYCDQIAMKALLMAQTDVRRGVLDHARQLRIRDTMRDLAEDLADRDVGSFRIDGENAPAALETPDAAVDPARPDAECRLPDVAIAPSWRLPRSILCIAGRSALDEAAAHLLADLLRERGIGASVASPDAIAGDAIEHGPDTKLLVLSLFDAAESKAQARFALRRLRRRLPGIAVLPAFWADAEDARVKQVRADVRCEMFAFDLPGAIETCLERASVGAQTEIVAAPSQQSTHESLDVA